MPLNSLVKNGTELEGEIIRATGSIVTLRLSSGTMMQLSWSDIDRIAIETSDRGLIEGELTRWSDGGYQISTPTEVLVVEGSKVVDVQPVSAEAVLPATNESKAAPAPPASLPEASPVSTNPARKSVM